MEHNSFSTGYTNFVDEIEEEFDDFFSRKGRAKLKKKRQQRKLLSNLAKQNRAKGMSRRESMAQAMKDLVQRKKDAVANRSTRPAMVREAMQMKRRPKYNERRPLIRKNMKTAIMEAKKRDELLDQDEIDETQIDETLNQDMETRNKGVASVTETSISGDNADAEPSFFEKNKMPILVVGGLAVAGLVYFKFIKK
jgi:hypothetical protein